MSPLRHARASALESLHRLPYHPGRWGHYIGNTANSQRESLGHFPFKEGAFLGLQRGPHQVT